MSFLRPRRGGVRWPGTGAPFFAAMTEDCTSAIAGSELSRTPSSVWVPALATAMGGASAAAAIWCSIMSCATRHPTSVTAKAAG